jgi:predicted DsbA family dithiol-disulfide isomerase
MEIEIWSDVMCPFCYIGKRRFENALAQFEFKNEIQVIWKSFQLDPSIKTIPGKSVNEYLAERKGIAVADAGKMNDQVGRMANELGLHYDFDKAVVANSFDAHRFSHLAAIHGLGDVAEESLFKAYFTEGKNIADHDTLVQLGIEIGLDPAEVRMMLESGLFSKDVYEDIDQAEEFGASGVPFFVIDRKYAVSGAQDTSVFLEALRRSFAEWKKDKERSNLQTADGEI